MSIPGSVNPLLLTSTVAAAGNYQIERSLRFNPVDTPYLQRVFSGNGSNMKIRTFSCWVKRSGLGAIKEIFSNYGGAGHTRLTFDGDTLYAEAAGALLQTTQVFRDVSAWYHILFAWDTTQATSSNRSKLYVNGTQITTFSTANYPAQNADTNFATTTGNNIIGQYQNIGGYVLDGYLAEVFFIDGQALTPSSFTEVSATTGQLIPKAYTGTYGTNGFWLKFSDNSAATAATLGKDYSGNSNNWTPNNLSVTAGSGNDSLVDTPTSYGTDTGAGGEVRGNYCVVNPLDNGGGLTLSNGNLEAENTAASSKGARCTIKIPSTGKWYFEGTIQTLGGSCSFGVATSASANPYLSASGTWHILNYAPSGVQSYPGGRGYTFTTGQVGNVLQVAYDADSGKLWFGVNNTYCDGSTGGTGNPGAGTNPTYTSVFDVFPAVEQYTSKIAINFGQRAFAYTAPSGFKALCDTNLGTPVVAKPSTVMDVITYTGTGSSLALPNGSSTPTSISFTPDFAWIKGRSGATDHALYDAVRGVQKDLVSNSTSAETTETTGLTAFGTNTFTVGSLAKLNTSSSTYVAWAWYAGGSTVSNTSGSITSQVRANATAGFSVVTYTGNGSSGATVGHGLGAKPFLRIIKRRDATSTLGWMTFHESAPTSYFTLNSTNAATAASEAAPTSTVFSLPADANSNASGGTYVAYAFAPVVGYSSFGSYTGNGSADGPFVYTGFRPKFVLAKCSSQDSPVGTSAWWMHDTARSPYNQAQAFLYANNAFAEGNNYGIDILSNGFKVRTSDSTWNASATFIYAAFAENPFQYARAR